jgi:hypothetical protein
MKLSVVPVLIACSCSITLAAEKPDFTGTWRLDGSPDQSSIVVIEQNDGDIHIVSKSKEDPTEIKCDTLGKECEGSLSGEPVTVRYWYNGPMLVQMAFEGKNNKNVTETRRTLSEDGTRMTVEVVQVVPMGKSPQHFVFVKQQDDATTAESRTQPAP